MVVTQAKQENILKGSLFAIFAFFWMALFGTGMKIAGEGASKLWISAIIYLTALICLLPSVIKKGLTYYKTEHVKYHILRFVFGLGASLLYLVALQQIPLVNATLLFNTTPIFIPLLAKPMLGSHISLRTWLAVFVGFIGVIFVINPKASLLGQTGDLVGLLSGFLLAVAFIYVKKLTPTEPDDRIVFYFLFFSTCFQLLLLPFVGEMPPLRSTMIAIGAGIAFFLFQLFVVYAYDYADASKIGIFQYSSIVFVGLIDWMLWGEIPSLTEFIGIALVILAGAIILLTSAKSR